MDGFRLQRVAIDYLEQAPLSAHRDDNILDVEGIKKITEKTAIQNIETHRLQQEEEETTAKREVEKAERLNELKRQEEESTAKTNREIAVTKARESATTEEETQKMRLLEEQARIATDEQIEIGEINKSREVEATELEKERVMVEQRENVQRSDELQKVMTNEQVTLREIEKDKKAEAGLKEKADITSERVAIERKIAIEEEETADIRNKSEADRSKLTVVTAAEAEAEEKAIIQVTSAEADKDAAKHKSEELETLANAKLMQETKEAEGKELLAKATEAEVAAPGLAQAKVNIANAEASEKQGLSDANVLEAKGKAEAQATSEKADALTKMNEAGMEFEKMDREFKLRETLGKEQIHADVEIASRQSDVVSAALKEAKIDIVGGSSEFLGHIQDMVTKGKGIDAMIDNSDTISKLGKEYLEGNRSLPQDVVDTISSLSSGDIANMSVAQFLQTSQGQSLAKMIPGGLASIIPGVDAK